MEEKDENAQGCSFCELFDFSECSVDIHNRGSCKYAHIVVAGGYGRFPIEKQFNYCPICGKPNRNKI